MPEPCDRKRCGGQLEEWASEIRANGRVVSWLVCDRDALHTVVKNEEPTAGEHQTSLFGEGDVDG